MLKAYYWLTKPGIIYGNDLPAIAGFLLASHKHIHYLLFIEMIVGLSLVIASACVFNNLLDRRIDSRMKRTVKRALVTGAIKAKQAKIYGTVLGAVGFGLLAIYTNWLTVVIALIGYVDYIIAYGWAKRHTEHSTLIGSVSGATPPVVGYVAVTGHLDVNAWLLFLTIVFWQMPHFYAIGIYRFNDYKQAKLPILTVKRGFQAAKIQSLFYIVAFAISASLLSVLGSAGMVYRVVIILLSIWWLYKAVQGFKAIDDVKWARGLFGISLIVMTAWSLLIAINNWLP